MYNSSSDFIALVILDMEILRYHVLPPFEIIRDFIYRFIVFAIHLDTYYVYLDI